MDLENIKNRIALDENNYGKNFLVEFDVEFLNNLFKEDKTSYIEPYGKNGIRDRYLGVGDYLKTGEKINATKVNFRDEDGKLKASILDGRHRFAFLRDIGLKTIPVEVSENSYATLKKFNLAK